MSRWDVRGLPDPNDHGLADWNGEPSYQAWHRRLNGDPDVFAAPSEFDLERRYAYAVPNNEALATLLALGPLVEIGAGGGYWARLLIDRCGDVIAYDRTPLDDIWANIAPPWSPVLPGGIEAARAHPDRALFVCWPPRPNGLMVDLLRSAPQTTLALIADGRNSLIEDQMYDLLEAEWTMTSSASIPRWGIRADRLMLWSRSNR